MVGLDMINRELYCSDVLSIKIAPRTQQTQNRKQKDFYIYAKSKVKVNDHRGFNNAKELTEYITRNNIDRMTCLLDT